MNRRSFLKNSSLGMFAAFTYQPVLQAGEEQGLSITYNLPMDGEVTLGIYDEQNRLLRTLLSGEFRAKGTVTDSWDGLDQWGQPIPAGNYTLKGIYHPQLTTEYVMSFGNPGTPPWPTMDDKGDWLSDEAAPQAAVTDGKWVYLGAPGCEKGAAIIAVDENGQRQWGWDLGFNPVTVSLALEGNYLYALFSGPQLTDASRRYQPGGANAVGRAILICIDKRIGKAARFTKENPRLKIATWPYTGATVGLWDLRTQKTFSPETYSGQPRYVDLDIGETTNAIGLACVHDRLYVSMHDDNKLLVLDAGSGGQIDEIPVPKPAGLCALADQGILAVSGQRVVQIDPARKKIQALVSSGLVAPRCVTSDGQNRIFVSDWGSSFQVKVFAPNGNLLRAIGKEGGRPWVGPWEQNGMLVPTGIAVTDAGKLWVAEDDSSPKRISVWNVETGDFLQEYIGPTPYGGAGAVINPKDPTDVYAMGLRLKLDYAAKTWTTKAIVERRMDINQPFALNGHVDYDPGGKTMFHDGREYQTILSRASLVIHMRKGDLLVPVAALGSISHQFTGDGTARTVWDSDLGYHLIENFYPPFFSGHAGNNYTWTDTNSDGIVQPVEMQWLEVLSRTDLYKEGAQPEASNGWGFAIGDDWSIYWSGFCKDKSFVFRLDIKGWTADGAPIYEIRDSQPIVVRDSGWSPSGLFATSDGKVVACYDYQFDMPRNAVECFDRNGKSLWALAMPHDQSPASGQVPKEILAENVIQEFQVPGLGKVLGSWLWHGNYKTYLFTDDGLYVSTILKDSHMGPYAGWDESFKGYYQDPKGVPYVINGANDTYHILRINGLDRGGRFEKPLRLTGADVARAKDFRDIPKPKPVTPPILNVTWVARPPRIDGDLSDWNMRGGVVIEGSKGRSAQVALSRDASNLYLAYHVTKDSPFSNKGANWQTLFITGDCVDLMLATDTQADVHRLRAAPGDQRLLLSVYQGKPIAVLYRPAVPGTKEPVRLMAARIDEIKVLDSAKIAIQQKGNSYTIEASVPLQDLGIGSDSTGIALQGDVGVIYSDETGSNRSLRLYYYNKKTGITADLTTEATLEPREWGIVQFPLGNNLLKNGGFEDGFGSDSTSGWFVATQTNGGIARIGSESSRSGVQSLILEQTKPVIFPPEAFNAPDEAAFLKLANMGAGAGEVIVEQRIPVVAGHRYDFRFNFRAEGLHLEKKLAGPDRGYAAFQARVHWIGSSVPPPIRSFASLDAKTDTADWKQLTNFTQRWSLLYRPHQAPEGATAVVIDFRLVTLTANHQPKAFVDDVEFVDVTPAS